MKIVFCNGCQWWRFLLVGSCQWGQWELPMGAVLVRGGLSMVSEGVVNGVRGGCQWGRFFLTTH